MSKKDQILDSAQSLMLDKGYVATSIDEICEKAGVTKGSFFYYFKDKEALGKEALCCFSENQNQAIFEDDCCKDPDPLKRIMAFIDCTIKYSKQPEARGCLVGIFAQELSTSHPELRKICGTSFKGFINHLRKDLTEAKKIYAPSAKFDPKEVAEYCLVTVQGSLILVRATQDRNIMARTLKQLKTYINTLYGT